MANVSIIGTPNLGPRDGDIETLGDCTSRIISDAAELFRTQLRRNPCATAVKDKGRSISHSACKTLDLNHIIKLPTTLHTVNTPHNASE